MLDVIMINILFSEYPFINKEADRYLDAKAEVYSCKEKKDGTYIDPNDCNRYYLCSNGYTYRMRCSKGTQWNQVLRACAFSFHPMYPCKQTALGYDVTSYPYGQQELSGVSYESAQLQETPQKESNAIEEFYHYF
jgi:Zn-finger protein